MRFVHPSVPGRSVRLGYCLNVHAAEDLPGVLRGLREVAGPVARRVGGGAPFGVGPWFAAAVADELSRDAAAFAALVSTLDEEALVPFTFNAFPIGGFHAAGLKADVYRPTWREPARRAFTRAVAGIATRLAGTAGADESHVSVSTHCGGFGTDVPDEAAATEVARGFAELVQALVALEDETGVRVVLSLEPEPRSSANDTTDLPALYDRIRAHVDAASARRPLGACLDACHAAVEFEEPRAAFERATSDGHPLGKIQFSSALRVPDAGDPAARAALFALDEPVYLHQVTGRRAGGLVRAVDLPEVRAAWEAGDASWTACEELRCHFHVPVDLDRVGGALETTRPFADAVLDAALDAPERWGSPELHVEVETYTWDVLPGAARGSGDRVDGLSRELEHARARLEARGWRSG